MAPGAQVAALVCSLAVVAQLAAAAAAQAVVVQEHSKRPRIRRSPTAMASVAATPDGAWDSVGSPC